MFLRQTYSRLSTIIAKIFERKPSRLGIAGLAIVLLTITGLLTWSPKHTPNRAEQPVGAAGTAEARLPEEPKTAVANNASPEPASIAAPQARPSVTAPARTAPPKTAPPFITANTVIQDTTRVDSPTCDFTVVLTASALYHEGQSPYASHTIGFTLSLQASDGSANFSQTFSHTFAPGETKQFQLTRSFKKPITEYTYQVKASGTMTVNSGSASLGPNINHSVTGSCGPRSPAP